MTLLEILPEITPALRKCAIYRPNNCGTFAAISSSAKPLFSAPQWLSATVDMKYMRVTLVSSWAQFWATYLILQLGKSEDQTKTSLFTSLQNL
jgi:hypothetical protein